VQHVRYVHTYVQNSMWVIVGYRWQLQSLPPTVDIPECATLSPLNISGFVFYSFSEHKFTKSSLPAQKFCASIFDPTFFEKVINHQSRVQRWVENLCRNEWRINRIILYVLKYGTNTTKKYYQDF
jgi:hypothetical protein